MPDLGMLSTHVSSCLVQNKKNPPLWTAHPNLLQPGQSNNAVCNPQMNFSLKTAAMPDLYLATRT